MPHPFVWVPAERARHASTDSPPNGYSYPTGTEIATLCGQNLIADHGELAWFWGTCSDCHVAAYELAGLEVPTTLKDSER